MMEVEVLDEEDSINCGRCRQVFKSIVAFKTHKLSCCNPLALVSDSTSLLMSFGNAISSALGAANVQAAQLLPVSQSQDHSLQQPQQRLSLPQGSKIAGQLETIVPQQSSSSHILAPSTVEPEKCPFPEPSANRQRLSYSHHQLLSFQSRQQQIPFPDAQQQLSSNAGQQPLFTPTQQMLPSKQPLTSLTAQRQRLYSEPIQPSQHQRQILSISPRHKDLALTQQQQQLPSPPQQFSTSLNQAQPVVYLNSPISERVLLNSILGINDLSTSNSGLNNNLSIPSIEVISSTADTTPLILPAASQPQYLQLQTLQQQQHHHQGNDIVTTYAVSEDDVTNFSAFIDVNNSIVASSQDSEASVTSEYRLLAPAPMSSRDATSVNALSSASKRVSNKKRSPLDDVIAIVDGSRTQVMAASALTSAVERATVMLDNNDNDNNDEPASDPTSYLKSPKKPRNKVMRLPAKTPLNLTAKSSTTSTLAEKSGRSRGAGNNGNASGGGNGATITQTQTTRVFKLSCPFCQKLFCKRFDLDAHARVHTGEKPFQCCICGKCFAQKSNVKKHLLTHKVWPDGRVSLPPKRVGDLLVDAVTDSQNGSPLSSSPVKDLVENLVSSYYCQFCEEKFSHWTKLSSHLAAEHKDRQVFKCRVLTCPETFAEAGDLVSHLSRCHDPSEIKYRCEECGVEFTSLRELGLHHNDHSHCTGVGGVGGDGAVSGTNTTGDVSASGVDSPQKKSSSSSSSARYICSHCGDKFAREEALRDHLKTVSHSFACQICANKQEGVGNDEKESGESKPSTSNHVFPSERLLRKHMKECHAVSKHVCGHCGKSFKTKALLNVHFAIHGPSSYECEDPQCRRTFKRKDQLTRHRSTVHGKRRFRCPFKSICSKRFGRRDQLRVHLKHAHEGGKTDRRPWKCRECGKGFLSRHHLLEHESTHGDNRKFRCELCGRGFLRKKQMTKHSCGVGDKWRRRKARNGEVGGGVVIEGAWRKSTLLRSGRQTKPWSRPDVTPLDDLDVAFQPLS